MKCLNFEFIRIPLTCEILATYVLKEAFTLFKNVWDKEYIDLYGKGLDGSNEFLFNDEIMILLLNNEVVGLMMSRNVDLSNEIYRSQKYFSSWPKNRLDYLAKLGQLEIHNHLCVKKDLLRSNGTRAEESISSILVKLSFLSYQKSDSNGVISYARNNRSVDKLVIDAGSKIFEKIEIRGVDSSLFLCNSRGIRKKIKEKIISSNVIDIYNRGIYGVKEFIRRKNSKTNQSMGKISLAG
ncbi:MAG: hypothetical protein AB8E15_00215 [Bdellovibrionales bacterium]